MMKIFLIFFLIQISLSIQKTIVIDTDVCGDDMAAINYLSNHENVNILGISVTGIGAAHLTPGTSNVLNILNLDETRIKVYQGANKAIDSCSNAFPPTFREEIDSIYGIELEKSPYKKEEKSAKDFLKELFTDKKNYDLILMSIGGMTNFATAFKELEDEGIKIDEKKISEIVIMGGAFHTKGNIYPFSQYYTRNNVSEWNIFIDPHATNIVLRQPFRKTFFSLDSTSCCPLSEEYIKKFSHLKNKNAEFMYKVMTKMTEKCISVPLFDAIVGVYITNNEIVGSFEKFEMKVIEEMNHEIDYSGRTIICETTDKDCFEAFLAKDVDKELFEKYFYEHFSENNTVV